MISISDAWRAAYPGAVMGFLALEAVANPRTHPELERYKEKLVTRLRTQYAGMDREQLRELPVLLAYRRYYRQFKKTYHVLLQLESIIQEERSIPPVAALVEAMFVAELDSLLLTAGHDLDRVVPPLQLDIASGEERYSRLNGQEVTLKAGDMFISDGEGVISSVIYGPDRRTCIQADTTAAIFTVYAPPGIGEQAVYDHLQSLTETVRLVSPVCRIRFQEVHAAGGQPDRTATR